MPALVCRTSAALATIVLGFAPVSAGAARPAAVATPIADATSNALLGAFVGAVLGVLVGKRLQQHSAQNDLAAEYELLRIRRTEEDIQGLKRIATSAEEYAVDHSGRYPPSLETMRPVYLTMAPYIPGSDPPAKYVYDSPALDPKYGSYDVRDNGGFDPTQDKLRNIADNTICTRLTCKVIIYTQSGGLYGMP